MQKRQPGSLVVEANKGIAADAAGKQVVWAAAAEAAAGLLARPRLPMSLAAPVTKEGGGGRND